MKQHIRFLVVLLLCITLPIPLAALASEKSTDSNSVKKLEYKYVASVDSKVFHKPTCEWAKKITERTFKGYMTREEAVKDGKRPCKVCKP